MNRAQYTLLCRMRSAKREAHRKEQRLKRINRDPNKQYDWDAWMTASGYANGLDVAVAALEAFINNGKKSKR